MEYDEVLARKIQKRYGLPNNRVYQWRFRGIIPDKYIKNNPERKYVKDLRGRDRKKLDVIERIIKNKYISFEDICLGIGVKHRSYYDSIKGIGFVSVKEMARIIKEYKRVVKELAAISKLKRDVP